MKIHTIALFGEAEKGEYRTPYRCVNILELLSRLGHPPGYSRGIHYAIQALLYQRDLIFFRVREEGFSYEDYLLGLKTLQRFDLGSKLTAICLPGVGDAEIIEAVIPICEIYHTLLITDESDFYDYLTEITAI